MLVVCHFAVNDTLGIESHTICFCWVDRSLTAMAKLTQISAFLLQFGLILINKTPSVLLFLQNSETGILETELKIFDSKISQ